METTRSFGEQLREQRLAAGLTQEALAERAGVSARGIQALERGESKPQRETARRLAGALGLPESADPAFLASAGPAPRRRTVAASEPPAAPPPPRVEPRDQGSRPPLVGRRRELALLEKHLAGEGPPVLLYAGEPGIGKSRLLQHAAQQAPAAGWRVLEGGCHRQGGQAPYAPLLEALEQHVRTRSPVQLRADLQGCAWLVRLLPELAEGPIEPLPRWVVTPEQERRLLFRAVARLLANVAGPAGTVLVLDDLQWAAADALELLVTLVRTAGRPLRVIGAYRTTEMTANHPLAVTCAELAEAQLATLHMLGPLADHEAEDLVASLLGGQEGIARAAAAQVVRRVGGVPFFLVSYARSLEGEGGAEPASAGLPWDLRQSLRRRIRALPEAGQALLAAAAVAGRVTPRALLLARAGPPGVRGDRGPGAGLPGRVAGGGGRRRLRVRPRRDSRGGGERPGAGAAAIAAPADGRSARGASRSYTTRCAGLPLRAQRCAGASSAVLGASR